MDPTHQTAPGENTLDMLICMMAAHDAYGGRSDWTTPCAPPGPRGAAALACQP